MLQVIHSLAADANPTLDAGFGALRICNWQKYFLLSWNQIILSEESSSNPTSSPLLIFMYRMH
jgi:hypothetical protein